MNKMNECFICLENDNLIDYNHECGKYKIHNECLKNWHIKKNYVCPICRKPLYVNNVIIDINNIDQDDINIRENQILYVKCCRFIIFIIILIFLYFSYVVFI